MMNRHRRPTRGMALALTLALLLTSCGGGGEASAATMHLRRTQGTVSVSDEGGQSVEPREGIGLYSGYQVGTRAASYAWIDLDEVKLAKMDENSEAEITKDGKALRIDVSSGGLYFNVTEPLAEDETMEIHSATMVTAIRGTQGWVTEDTVCLLEGTVTVTAGDQTVTISAGEMAYLSEDGLDTRALTAGDIPAFVSAELEDGGGQGDIPADAPAETPEAPAAPAEPLSGEALTAAYEDIVNTEENVVYSEILDFVEGGDPELLIIRMDFSQKTAADVGYAYVSVYRNGPEGVENMYGGGGNMHAKGNYSLFESDGRLFVRQYFETEHYGSAGYTILVTYYGLPTPESERVRMVDELQVNFREDGRVEHGWTYRIGEDGKREQTGYFTYGEAPEYTETIGKYTPVRDLVSFDGENVTAAGQ